MCTNDSKTHTLRLRKNRKNGYKHFHDPEIIVIKPRVENIVKNRKKSIVQVLRKLSDYGLEESRKDCICKREPCSIVCSGKDCDYSFTGRLAASCDQHPGDNYLMDHSPRCPRCEGKLGKHSIKFANEDYDFCCVCFKLNVAWSRMTFSMILSPSL